jgi:uncharacterized RDD family membrane protein YckC
MAYCANCGTNISDVAASCPNCGHPTGAAATSGELAGFWIRFAALFIDGLILAIPSILLSFGSFAASGAFGRRFGWVGPFPFSFGSLVLSFVYNWLMIGMYNGQTLGKKLLGIRIARPDGTPVDVTVAAVRAGMALVSRLVLSLGYLWAAWDPEKRTWHDIVADTRAFRVYQ